MARPSGLGWSHAASSRDGEDDGNGAERGRDRHAPAEGHGVVGTEPMVGPEALRPGIWSRPGAWSRLPAMPCRTHPISGRSARSSPRSCSASGWSPFAGRRSIRPSPASGRCRPAGSTTS